jgi:bifunctional UDP-N-acetylglucosamine pyrophosphorylase/glucosamine-1-phosphate N-acetyltransferase
MAAGKGTRMRSSIPKVLHKIAHKPLLNHVIDTAETLRPKHIICVVGPDVPTVEEAAKPHKTVIQKERLGTGHALKTALSAIKDFKGTVMVLSGDVPLITADMLEDLVARHEQGDTPAATIMAMMPDEPTGYGRIVLNDAGHVERIVEEKDASDAEKAISLCNGGVYCFDGEGLHTWIEKLSNDNAQKEYLLPDLIAIAKEEGRASVVVEGDDESLLGVNTRDQLAELEMIFQNRQRMKFLDAGVTMQDPATVYFAADTQIAADVTIEPSVIFGEGVTVEEGCIIKGFSHIEGAYICANSKIGPFARLRPGTNLAENVEVGNFVEVNRSTIGKGTKAKHFTYLGDAVLHKDVNIGAGTIICNYDGINKHKTIIKDRAFIGSNSTLIAPLTVGEGAYIAAGSAVTEDVEKESLVIARTRGKLLSGWAKDRNKSKK